jgi:hypothetical protein
MSSLVLIFSLNDYEISSLFRRYFGIAFVCAFAVGGVCIDVCVRMTACRDIYLLICQEQGCVFCRSVEHELRFIHII